MSNSPTRKKTRINSKVDTLPEEIKARVDEMIIDTSNTYNDIAEWIKEQGYEVSKSSVGRYALRTNAVTQRLIEAQKQTEALVNIVKRNPEVDYTDAGLIMLMDGLVKKLSIAEDEFDKMPLDKAGRLITAISRTKIYKDKVKSEITKRAQLAMEEFKREIRQELAEKEPEIMERLIEVANRVGERMTID